MDDEEEYEITVRAVRFRKSVLWHIPLILVEHMGEALSDIADTIGVAVSAHIAYLIDRDEFHAAAAKEIEAITAGEE